ncbi:hypothetical protein BDW02DRAFT_537556, partial [Decorospora gaudefroyi]
MSFLQASIKAIFPKKTPTATIAGLTLTRDQAQSILETIQTLEPLLVEQTAEIEAFPSTEVPDSYRAQAHIANRHSAITKSLSELIARVSGSKALWLQELADAQPTMARKIRVCNRASRPTHMGCKAAAVLYWPLICETYAAVSNLLVRLKGEVETALGDDLVWTQEGKTLARRTSRFVPNAGGDGKRVTFRKNVQGRYFGRMEIVGGEAGKNNEFTAALTNDGKNTVRQYKQR